MLEPHLIKDPHNVHIFKFSSSSSSLIISYTHDFDLPGVVDAVDTFSMSTGGGGGGGGGGIVALPL